MTFQKGRTKTGGRKKGTRAKKDVARDLAITLSGMTPKAFMKKVLDGEPIAQAKPKRHGEGFMKGVDWHYPTFEDMKWAAQNLAQYIHPKLSSVRVASSPTKTHEEWLREIEAGPIANDGGGKSNGDLSDAKE